MKIFNRKKNVLIIGSDSMLGYDLFKALVNDSNDKYGVVNEVMTLDHNTCDISKNLTIKREIKDKFRKCDYVVNCAAYTNTGKCEDSGKNESYEVNALGCLNLAEMCNQTNCKLIHISTDYVFSEKSPSYSKTSNGFSNTSIPFPINTYGFHKLLGEQFIQSTMKPENWTVLRTSWLFGAHKKKSFVHRFLNNVLSKEPELDGKIHITRPNIEHSIPTYTYDLCEMILNVIRYKITGIHNARSLSNTPISRLDWMNEILKIYAKNNKDFNLNNIVMEGSPMSSNMKWPEYSFLSVAKEAKLYDGIYWGWDDSLNTFIVNNLSDFRQ